MELIMLCIALFVFCFGSVIAIRAIEFGFAVGDKALEHSGTLMKLPFKLAFKLICFLGKRLIRHLMKSKPYEYTVKPIFDVTPLELQHMRNKNLIHSNKRQPVLIEHPPQNSN